MPNRAAAFDDVTVRALRKVFDRRPVLSKLACRLESGQITVIMGPNGAGKSTLLSVLSMLSQPTSGQVRYGDHDHRYAARYLRRFVGLLAHSPLLYGDLTVRENLTFFAKLYGVAAPQETAARWIERVGLAGDDDRPLRELSHGMRQRAALARALLHDPQLLLFDEPFSGLDRSGLELLRSHLIEAREAKRIVAVVTHEVQAADQLADQLLVLHRGRVARHVAEPNIPAAQLAEHYHAVL